jgi:hypothetical protein
MDTLSGDTRRLLLPCLSHKTLYEFSGVSKIAAAWSHEEAVRRYFTSKKEYMHWHIDKSNADLLATRGAYYFLAGTKISIAHACVSRDMDMVDLAVKHGATDYYEGCIVAALLGERDMVDLAVEHEATDYYEGCIVAALLGERDIFAKWSGHSGLPQYDKVLATVLGEKYKNIFRLPRTRMATRMVYDVLNYAAAAGDDEHLINHICDFRMISAIRGICQGHRTDLMDKIFDKVLDSDLIEYAGDNVSVVKYLVEKKNVVLIDDTIIQVAIVEKRYKTAAYLLDVFPSLISCRAFWLACESGRPELVERTMSTDEAEIHAGLIMACKKGRTNNVAFLSTRCEADWNQALLAACGHTSSVDMAKFCVERGATNLEEATKKASRRNKQIAHYLVDAMFP